MYKLFGSIQPTANPPADGTPKTNTFIGSSISDTFYGYTGTDFMFGNDGSDRLYGYSGKDQLTGGNGQDFLYGGNGADLFIYNSAAEAGQGASADVIGDFKTADDHLVLTSFMAGGKFIGNAAFTKGAGPQVSYDAATGVLNGDVNGDGKADFQIAFSNHVVLAAGDFIF
jgi:Ca2+-binding RTX toxin-like protein